jgi:hypothetical protein
MCKIPRNHHNNVLEVYDNENYTGFFVHPHENFTIFIVGRVKVFWQAIICTIHYN